MEKTDVGAKVTTFGPDGSSLVTVTVMSLPSNTGLVKVLFPDGKVRARHLHQLTKAL